MQATTCLNCNEPIAEGQRFCGRCGQKSPVHRFTLAHFFHEFFHAFTHTDKGILHLLKGLATQPGVVAKEYIEGKRKKYFNPFTFFLILMGAYVLSSQFFTTEKIETAVPQSILRIPNEEVRAKAIGMFERGVKLRTFTRKSGNILGMIAVPLIAWVFWLAYRKRSFNYAEHLTATMMFTAFANLVFTLIIFPLQKLAAGTWFASVSLILGFILQALYFTWAYGGLLAIERAAGYLKAFAVSLMAIFLWFLFSATTMAIYIYQSWHFYEFFTRMFQ